MVRIFLVVLLCLAGMTAFAATLTVDGKTVNVPVVEVNGKAFVDIVALMKLLGGAATYNVATHKVSVSSTTAGSGGTAELAGENGVFGKVYSIRKESPLYFCLKRAEYTTAQVVLNDRLYTPNADEKLLVLHFSVQNPQKSGLFIRGDMALGMTVVDAMNVNHNPVTGWADEENRKAVSLTLKPAQKLDVYAVFAVPAKGPVPKLMVLPGDNNGPILRYDLHDKVTALPAPFADAADPTGATALTTVPAKMNVVYPFETWSASVDGFTTTTDAILEHKLDPGDKYMLVNMTVKNMNTFDIPLRYDTFAASLTSTRWRKLAYHSLLFASSYREVGQKVPSGEVLHVRLYFTVPKGVTAKTLTLKQGDSRSYVIDVKE